MKTLINDIDDSYCSFEVSMLLREKGFNCLCRYYFDDKKERHQTWMSNSMSQKRICQPTHALAIEWLRINFDMHINVIASHEEGTTIRCYYPSIDRVKSLEGLGDISYENPEEANDAALLYCLIELIKDGEEII